MVPSQLHLQGYLWRLEALNWLTTNLVLCSCFHESPHQPPLLPISQPTVFVGNSLKIVFNVHENTMAVDWNTARVLEIVNNMRDHRNIDHTLYGVVTNAKTRGGKKLLRTTLLGVKTRAFLEIQIHL